MNLLAQDRKITMNDIAQRLGISKNAVSLALGGKSGVSDPLRRKVIETARQMGYCGRIPQNENGCIVALVPEYIHNDAYFYSDIFWAVEQQTRSIGHTFSTISISRQDEADLVLPQFPQGMEILGVLCIGVLSQPFLKKLIKTGVRLMSVDIAYNNLPISSITSANLAGGYQATEYLIQRGHREIGFVGPIRIAQSVYERWCGFQQAMAAHHLPIYSDYNILGDFEHFQLLDMPDVLLPYFNKIKKLPTAWFCAGDRIALSMLSILSGNGMTVPRDISIIGYDNLDFGKLSVPPLTTIAVDRKAMGRIAVQLLAGDQPFSDEESGEYVVSLANQLVERASVKNLNA